MNKKNHKKHFNTKAIHEGQNPEKPYGAVSLPIYQTSTFKQNEFGEYIFDYSRADNPTRKNLEENIASLEGGIGGIAFASGMAAISNTLGTFLKSGDRVVSIKDSYGGTNVIFNEFTKSNIGYCNLNKSSKDRGNLFSRFIAIRIGGY